MHICGIAVNFPGAKRPLQEGSKMGMWDFILLNSSNVKIPAADVYIFAAWHPAYQNLLGLCAGSKLGVLWTSSIGEMDFEVIEQEYLYKLLQDPRISFIWFGDPALARIYPEKGFYAPYPFDVDSYEAPHVEKKDIATLFCPTGPKKNILNQLLAMRLVQKEMKLTLHTNVEGYGHVIKDLDYIRHEWLPDVEYRELLASAKINLACSWCETFDYNVAEAAVLGTASVISRTIPLPGMIVGNPNNVIHIAEQILMGCGHGIDHKGILDSLVTQIRIRNQECKRILSSLYLP